MVQVKAPSPNVLWAITEADDGELLIHGNKTEITNPKDAHRHGVGMVYQHFMLVDNMTVAENLMLARDAFPFVFDWTREKKSLLDC